MVADKCVTLIDIRNLNALLGNDLCSESEGPKHIYSYVDCRVLLHCLMAISDLQILGYRPLIMVLPEYLFDIMMTR